MRHLGFIALLLCAASCLAQEGDEKVFEWVPASQEAVQLDPSFYHTGRVYRPGSQGGNLHVDIEAALPVTIAMAYASEWNDAQRRPDKMANVQFRCIREHVVKTTYECHLPGSSPMVLTIHDERRADHAVVSGIGAIMQGGRAMRQLVSPNDVLIGYYRWACTENCNQPEYRWVRLLQEKYELTAIPKIYSILTPDHDGQQVSVNIKAPVPMTVALLPTAAADQLSAKPDTLEIALANTSCKQRGVQKLEFECTLNLKDGPQSLVVLPSAPNVPRKKAEIGLQAVKCVENCGEN